MPSAGTTERLGRVTRWTPRKSDEDGFPCPQARLEGHPRGLWSTGMCREQAAWPCEGALCTPQGLPGGEEQNRGPFHSVSLYCLNFKLKFLPPPEAAFSGYILEMPIFNSLGVGEGALF